MEGTMLKQLSVCAALITFAADPVIAQQREAILHKVEVPGAAFEILFAVPKVPSTIIDLSESPDALVVHLVGGELVLGFESAERMLETLDVLRSPLGALHVKPDGANAHTPVAVYFVPKGRVLASAGK
jgi:hypothetical protein